MEHQFPNGVNFPLVAADLHWEFFKQSVATDVKEIRLPDNIVNIYPNPSNSEMTIDLSTLTEGGECRVSVFNTLGQVVYFNKKLDQKVLYLSKTYIGNGIFTIKITHGQQFILKRIIFE